MRSEELFCLALGIDAPWYVKSVELVNGAESSRRELHIYLDFKSGSKFVNSLGNLCGVHDSEQKRWRHLNFFEHECYLHARVPRVKDPGNGKVEQVSVPWARPGSGFTLLFEALALCMIENEMAVNAVASMLRVTAHRLWRVFSHYVEKAVAGDNLSDVKSIGVDETSVRKGHNYVTVVVDMEKRRTTFVTEGKDSSTLERYAQHLERHEGNAKNIKWASIDMSPAFIAGVGKQFPNASIVFDKFHLMKKVNEALDETRRKEQQESKLLKGHRYTVLKNKNKLSDKKKQELEWLLLQFPTLGEAYRLREMLQGIWQIEDSQEATAQLEAWCDLASHSKAIAFKDVVKVFRAHWSGIIAYFKNRITNAILENTNLKIQSAKRRARGFRNIDYFIKMIYFLTAKIKCCPLNAA